MRLPQALHAATPTPHEEQFTQSDPFQKHFLQMDHPENIFHIWTL
jgi:hypothetical protein